MARVLGRVWLTGLLVLGLVAGLLGVAPPGAVGTHGDEADVDYEASYSACVGAATESFGFEDTEGSFAEEAIDCLAHYGITTGRSATMYAPSESVLRWQMALFLARAAAAAGIVLENPAPDQGFTDIGGVSEEAQNAINGLAAAEIMPGASQTAFSPNSAVNRGSMAMLLDAFLAQATPGTGAFGGDIEKYSDVEVDNYNVFTDISTVSLNTYNAIYRIYEVGVTQGIAEHQFGPDRNVTRAQMAAFITRAFAHTIARPAGVSIQAEKDSVLGESSVQLIVSVRDTMFQPLVDTSVDVFRSTDPDNAFGEDGTCNASAVGQVGNIGRAVCEVDTGDETTDAAGDVTALQLQVTDADVTVWAWTGDRADKFDSDDTASAQLTVGFSKAASQLLVTDNLEEGQTHLQFGETATVTVQVANEDDEPVAEKDVRVTVAQVITPDVSKESETSSSTNSFTTDASGKFELSFTRNDPSTGDDENATVALTLSNPSSYVLQDEDGDAFASKTYTWSDDTGDPAKLTLETRQDYVEASDEKEGASATVTATLTDQFGNPVRGQRIYFWSDNPAGVGEEAEDALINTVRTSLEPKKDSEDENQYNARVRRHGYWVFDDLRGEARYWRTTNRAGQATLTYSRDATTAVVETVRARLVRGEDDAKRVDDDEEDLLSERVAVYWVAELDDDDSATGRILVKDADNNRVVFVDGDGRARMADYDSNDQFNTGGTPMVFSDFEKFLRDTAGHISVSSYATTAGEVSTFGLDAEWAQVDLSDIPVPADRWSDLRNSHVHYAADGGTIVVSSFYHNNYAGAVWVYDGVDDTDPQMLTAPTPQTYSGDESGQPWRHGVGGLLEDTTGGWFGWAVDIRGDTLVVGEPGRLYTHTDNEDYPMGAVHVFTGGSNGGSWAHDATLTVTNTSSGLSAWMADRGTLLGRAVAVSKDEKVVAASAPEFFDTGADRISGMYVFTRPDQAGRAASAGKWDDQDGSASPRLQLSPTEAQAHRNRWTRAANDRNLAISEDGSSVVVGGAEGSFGRVVDGVRYWDAGAAFVFTMPSAGWSTTANTHQDAVFYSPDPYIYEKLGRSVAVSANGDTIVVSDNYRANTMRRGKALVFVRPDQTGRSDGDAWEDRPEPVAVLTGPDHPDAPDTCAPAGMFITCNLGDNFGQWVDITDDGMTILASRSSRAEDNQRGSTHVFTKPAAGWSSSAPSFEYQGSEPEAKFGWRNHFDQANGNIVALEGEPVVIYQIER